MSLSFWAHLCRFGGPQMRVLLILLIFASCNLMSFAASAQTCDYYLSDGKCGPIGRNPAPSSGSADLKTNRNLLNVTTPRKKDLLKDALYTVNLVCRRIDYNSANNPWGLFVNKQRTTSHTIAITNQRIPTNVIPTDARAMVMVYSISDGAQTSNTFINDGCNTSFLISGKDTIYLAATANQTDTDTPGVMTNALFDLVKMALNIVPLFSGTTFASHWAPSFNAAVSDQSTLTDVFAQLSKGDTITAPADLYEGTTTVTTPYSRVDITISRIKSLVALNNRKFTADFEKTVDTAKATLKLDTLSGDALSSQCDQFAADMIARDLAVADASYALAYATMLFHLDRDKTLTCLGSDYALPALEFKDLWLKFYPKTGALYNADDVKTKFQDDETPKPAQPLNFNHIQSTLNHALNTLGTYLQLAPDKQTPATKAALLNYFSSTLNIDNSSDVSLDDGKIAPNDFATKLAVSIKHVGCLTSDTVGAAIFFGFEGTGTNSSNAITYSGSDAIAFRIWIDSNSKIIWLQLTSDDAASLLEKALQARGSRICNHISVAAPPKPPS